MPVTCEPATHLAMLDFPAARPQVMDARRTFLEKAAAIHVACRKGCLEADYRAMTDSGMLRGEFPSFPELLERIAVLEQQCNAISRTFA
jgi:hypothetical protein